MLSLLLLLLLLAANAAAASRVWPVQSVSTLIDAVLRSETGDVIELESGDYTLTTPLSIERPLTVRSRNRLARAVLRSASPEALLFIVTASQVTLADLIVGAQTSGISDERSLDIYVGAGTQLGPLGADKASGGASRRRSVAVESRAEIAVARAFQINNGAALRKRSAGLGDDLRALYDVVLRNIDFSNSRSGANVAFARGAYSGVHIEQCTFGRRGAAHINAIVSVAEARFAGLIVQRNTFAGSSHILLGDVELADQPNAIGLNYWPEALEAENGHSPPVYIGGSRHLPTTYCLDAACALLAPIIDSAKPTNVYASLAAAAAAGVRHMVLTDDTELDAPVVLALTNTVIEGTRSANKAPLITVRSGGALVSRNGALAGIRNVRFALAGANVAAIVYTDGAAEALTAAAFVNPLLVTVAVASAPVSDIVLFDGVSLMGDDSADQVALVISAPGVRVELEDSVIVQTAIGVLVHRGAVAMLDTTVFGAKRSAVLVETSTRRAGLRVSSSSFIGCQVAIETSGSAGISALAELYVSCSQFLFNVQRDPLVARECVGRPALCASALRYNSIISEQSDDARVQTTSGTALRRLLRQGSNHFEHARKRVDYVYYGTPTHMRFEDDQGRFDGVSAVLIGDSPAAFVLASYSPVVEACFTVDALGAQASVVSDVLEVRSDKLLHTDDALSVRFRTKDRVFAKTPLAIYTVAHLGTDAVLWTQASTSKVRPEYNNWVVDATLGARDASLDKHAHRAVVVALGTPSDVRDESAENGVASSTVPPRTIAKRLCVVCNEKSELPPRLLDEFCDGSTENVRDSFDKAYEELGFGRGSGAPRKEGASIYIYGDCATERCTVALDHNENLEGTSSEERGTLRSKAEKCGEKQAAFIDFLPRASPHSALHNLLIEPAAGIECAVGVQPSSVSAGPVVAYNTISGALCIDGRAGGLYVNNDIAARDVAVYVGGQFAPQKEAAVVFEANVIVSGNLVIDVAAAEKGAVAQEIQIERASFAGAEYGVFVHGASLKLLVSGCTNLGRFDTSGVDDATSEVQSKDNQWSEGAVIALHNADVFSGGDLTGVEMTIRGQVRLDQVLFDAKCKLTIDRGDEKEPSACVLTNVYFESIGECMHAYEEYETCHTFELSVVGLDLERCSIYDLKDRQILTPANARIIADDLSAYWTRAGEIEYCESGHAVRRNEKECGCPTGDTQNGEDPAVIEEPTLDDDDDDDATSSALWWVLIVALLVLVACGVGICVFAACTSAEPTASVASATVRSSAHFGDDNDDEVEAEDKSYDKYNLLRRRGKKHAN